MAAKKIIHILTAIILIGVPLIFSHIYFPFTSAKLYDLYAGEPPLFTPESSSTAIQISQFFSPSELVGYERVKVTFFLVFSALLLPFLLIKGNENLRFRKLLDKKNWVFVILLTILLVSFLSWGISTFDVLVGSINKRHGFFMVLGLAVTFSALKTLPKKYIERCIIAGGILLLLYGFLQWIGMDPNLGAYRSRTELSRIFSTLGNSNYFAGYLLVFIPFLAKNVHRFWARILLFLVIVSIYLTGSFIALGILALYGIYYVRKKWTHVIATICLCLVAFMAKIGLEPTGQLLYHFLFYPPGTVREVYLDHLDLVTLPEKIRGFLARPYFWSTSIHILFSSIEHFLFGIGPDQLMNYYQEYRHPFLMHDIFEHTNWTADRSHNFFLDVWLFWGLIPFIGIVALFYHLLKKGTKETKQVVLLFSSFFFFNIPVITHYIVLMALIVYFEKNHAE